MANLKFYENELFEKLFNDGGYVKGFSSKRQLGFFFRDFSVDILSEKYNKDSGSMMNRLRAFWEIESDILVGKVLKDLLEYVNSIETIDSKDFKQATIYINGLLGIKESSNNVKKEVSEDEFLNQEFKNIDISLLNLETQTEIINQRLQEIKNCLNSNAPLSVIFLCGSTLEGILLNLALQNMKEFNTSKSAPKKDGKVKQFHEWSLSDLINVSYEQNFIGLDIKKFSHALRDFRNFIHPYQQMSLNFNPDIHTAKISWQVLQATIYKLSNKR